MKTIISKQLKTEYKEELEMRNSERCGTMFIKRISGSNSAENKICRAFVGYSLRTNVGINLYYMQNSRRTLCECLIR
jgi:hypothetical protein